MKLQQMKFNVNFCLQLQTLRCAFNENNSRGCPSNLNPRHRLEPDQGCPANQCANDAMRPSEPQSIVLQSNTFQKNAITIYAHALSLPNPYAMVTESSH